MSEKEKPLNFSSTLVFSQESGPIYKTSTRTMKFKIPIIMIINIFGYSNMAELSCLKYGTNRYIAQVIIRDSCFFFVVGN
jgi:hypothetical protein